MLLAKEALRPVTYIILVREEVGGLDAIIRQGPLQL
jgi:hypothetical protein